MLLRNVIKQLRLTVFHRVVITVFVVPLANPLGDSFAIRQLAQSHNHVSFTDKVLRYSMSFATVPAAHQLFPRLLDHCRPIGHQVESRIDAALQGVC